MGMQKAIVVGLSALLATAAAVVRGAQPDDQVDPADIGPLNKLVAEWRGAAPAKPRRVLLFSECFGYNHRDGRRYGDYAFTLAGKQSGAWQIFHERNVARLADKGFLAGFDAIVFNNSTGVSEAKAPGLTEALMAYVKGGRGIALIHSGLDAFKDSDRLMAMFGGLFRGHPWHYEGTWRFLNEAAAHPVNAAFRGSGTSFSKQDEIYQFPTYFDRKTCKVLISIDLSDPATKAAEDRWRRTFGPGATRTDHDYAVSWVKTSGKGRIFYTSFGHGKSAFLDRECLYHMFAGLQYVLCDIDDGAEAKSVAMVP